MKRKNNTKLTYYINSDLFEDLKKYAKFMGWTNSHTIEVAIRNYLNTFHISSPETDPYGYEGELLEKITKNLHEILEQIDTNRKAVEFVKKRGELPKRNEAR